MIPLEEHWGKRILLCDGAMGTQIAARAPAEHDVGGHGHCPEYLVLSRPDLIAAIHRDYLAAGADIIETNTFGAHRLALAPYGLADRAEEINRRAAALALSVAYDFYRPDLPRFVAGAMGPGNLLPTLRQVSFAELAAAYREQAAGLLTGGVHLLIVETAQDLVQVKAALCGIADACSDLRTEVPVIVQVTIAPGGRMLLGTPIEAVIAALAPYPLSALGLNCGTGPDLMREAVRTLATQSPFPVSLQPNAGLPQVEGGVTRYPQDPATFVAILEPLLATGAIFLVGGCCGTTPAHIAALRRLLDERGIVLRQRPSVCSSFSSLYGAQPVDTEPRPLLIGERLNANGSREFRSALEAEDLDRIRALARAQEAEGAHLLDLNVAVAGRSEVHDMARIVEMLVTTVHLPLSIDSTSPQAVETALSRIPGRALVNSTNLERPEVAAQMIALARRYGAALVMLTIDEEGMADSAERKLAVARRLVSFAEEHGLPRDALFIDPLTFSLASGDPRLRGAAQETLTALRRIKEEVPGVRTLLGVSNVSYGLKPAVRRVLTSLFLYHAVQAGLDAAICHAGKILPLSAIAPAVRAAGEALLFNDWRAGDPLERFLACFNETPAEDRPVRAPVVQPIAVRLTKAIIEGQGEYLASDIAEALTQQSALEVLEQILLPAMRQVGDLFGSGAMQLPFVLRAAETMKRAVDILRPHLESHQTSAHRGKVLLATVRGDIHDIGKNLVAIILASNGWEVVDLGTDCSASDIVSATKEHRPDFVGLSGLLVRSALEMKEVARAFAEAELSVPLLCGGAALASSFVAQEVAPLSRAPVWYAADAFEALGVMERRVVPHKQLVSSPSTPRRLTHQHLAFDHPPLTPPWLGRRLLRSLPVEELFGLIDKKRLFRVRWDLRDSREGEALLQHFAEDLATTDVLAPAAVVALFPGYAREGSLVVEGEAETVSFSFPERPTDPPRALSAYFRPERDTVVLFAVTIGNRFAAEKERRRKAGHYRDYFFLHGLGAELAEACAALVHRTLCRDLGILVEQTIRVGPGFPSWPDLTDQRKMQTLLRFDEIGITLSSGDELVPLESVTALVVCHPQAEYL